MPSGGARRAVPIASAAGAGEAMSRPTVVPVAIVAVFAVMGVGCSGGDDAAPSSSAASVSTTIAVSSAPTSTIASTVAPTTLPTTSPPTTTSGTDATTSSTTIPTKQQAKRDVIAAARAAWQSLNDLRLDPTNDALLEALALTRTGASLESAIDIIATYRADDLRAVTNDEFPAYFQPIRDSVIIDGPAGTASLEYCRLGSNLLVEVGGNPDGTDLVLDESISAYRERSDLVLTETGWLESGGVVLQQFEGATRCDA